MKGPGNETLSYVDGLNMFMFDDLFDDFCDDFDS